MAVTYPGTFPCPMIDSYTIDVDAGLLRSKERGKPTQRRVFSTMPQSIKCKFSLTIREWGYWQEWLTKTALGWFWIDLPSLYAGLHRQRTFPHLVRLTSQITIDARSDTHVTASVTFEMSPSMFKQYMDAT